ncbi:MAG: hypothetical protein NC124_18215 [Clostridium sp.]|nr:hypothetical protein [Ruminococcus flavefaciens]MCM1500401.1 hypothetical protein [Clostridium sp.]
MNQFNEFVKKHFGFLQQYGYICSEDKSEDITSFAGKNNQIDVIFSAVKCELTCRFVDNSKRMFTLQDGLGYGNIKDFKGLYQVSSIKEIEKGVAYLADAVKTVFNKINISDAADFQRIYQYRLDIHKELLEDYYLKTDIKKAEECWKNGEYDKARELFEKHINYLSKAQIKKLEYVKKNI